MSKYIFLKDSNGQLYKFLADDDTGLKLQQSTNGDPATFSDLQTSIDVMDYDGWYRDQVALMHELAPALTNFREVKPGDTSPTQLVGAPSAVFAATVVGGGVTNEAAKNVALTYASIFQAHATTSWAMAFRAIIPPSVGGKFNFAGMINDGNNNYAGVAAYSVADATHYVITTYDGQEVNLASTITADSDYHDFVIAFDGTTISLYVDGELGAELTDLTGLTSDTMWPSITGTDAGAVKCVRAAYGYIAP